LATRVSARKEKPQMSLFKSRRSKVVGLVLLVAVIVAAGWSLIHMTPSSAGFRLSVSPERLSSPDFRLTDFNGRARSLADYRGRIVVIFFGFIHCADACPAELFKLGQVMKRLGPESDRVQVLLISLDPERDTPDLLKKYVTAFDPRFIGLTGTAQQLASAAKTFYVVYVTAPTSNDYYAIDHSTSTYVIDAQGRRRLIGSMSTSVDDFVHDLKLLIRGLNQGV
jgi:protein SCO1